VTFTAIRELGRAVANCTALPRTGIVERHCASLLKGQARARRSSSADSCSSTRPRILFPGADRPLLAAVSTVASLGRDFGGSLGSIEISVPKFLHGTTRWV